MADVTENRTAETATYENEHVFRADDEAWENYQAYMAEHDEYRNDGGIVIADDFVDWLNYSRSGQISRDRILSENDT